MSDEDETPAYVTRARTLIREKQVTEAATELLGGLKQNGDCLEAKVLLDEIFSGRTTSRLLSENGMGAAAARVEESQPAAGAATVDEELHMLEMTAEAAEEHEWWIYWLSFIGASLLGVLLLAGTFCSVAVSPGLANGALPLSGFASFVVTMIVCCRIHARHKRYQPGVFIPVISELGILQPGTVSALILLFCSVLCTTPTMQKRVCALRRVLKRLLERAPAAYLPGRVCSSGHTASWLHVSLRNNGAFSCIQCV